jgi:hypothetical protein
MPHELGLRRHHLLLLHSRWSPLFLNMNPLCTTLQNRSNARATQLMNMSIFAYMHTHDYSNKTPYRCSNKVTVFYPLCHLHRHTISTSSIGLNTFVNTNCGTCCNIFPFNNKRLDFNWLVTNKNNSLVIHRHGWNKFNTDAPRILLLMLQLG